MLLGNREIIAGVAKIKSHSDRGMFYPLQLAALAPLNGETDFMAKRNRMFQARRDVVATGLSDAGIELAVPMATFYVWAHVPQGFDKARDFCFTVLDGAALWTIPGSMYG